MCMQEPSDETLMGRFADTGCESDFTPLFRKFFPKLSKTAFFILRSTREAEDAVQECFLRVIQARKSYRVAAPFAPWIFTILRNTCIDALRRRRHAGEPLNLHDIEAPVDRSPETTELMEKYRKEVKTLDEIDQMILSLRFHNLLDYKEIATIVGLSHEATKKRAYRAVSDLRERLFQ